MEHQLSTEDLIVIRIALLSLAGFALLEALRYLVNGTIDWLMQNNKDDDNELP